MIVTVLCRARHRASKPPCNRQAQEGRTEAVRAGTRPAPDHHAQICAEDKQRGGKTMALRENERTEPHSGSKHARRRIGWKRVRRSGCLAGSKWCTLFSSWLCRCFRCGDENPKTSSPSKDKAFLLGLSLSLLFRFCFDSAYTLSHFKLCFLRR